MVDSATTLWSHDVNKLTPERRNNVFSTKLVLSDAIYVIIISYCFLLECKILLYYLGGLFFLSEMYQPTKSQMTVIFAVMITIFVSVTSNGSSLTSPSDTNSALMAYAQHSQYYWK